MFYLVYNPMNIIYEWLCFHYNRRIPLYLHEEGVFFHGTRLLGPLAQYGPTAPERTHLYLIIMIAILLVSYDLYFYRLNN